MRFFTSIALMAACMLAAPACAAATTSFREDFSGTTVTFPDGRTKLYPDPGNWGFTFWPGIMWPTSYGDGTNWLGANAECQTYVTPFITAAGKSQVPAEIRYDPFTIRPDGLHIRASLLSPEQQAAYRVGDYRRFGSGMLLSRYVFTYGKIRIVAKLPSAEGSWPALWLLPDAHKWPPEIDILEGMAWGDHRQQSHIGMVLPKGQAGAFATWIDAGADLSQGFHEYGVDWDAGHLTWLLDGKVIMQRPTPPSLKQPMYLIINLAVGGKWVFNEMKIPPTDGTSPERLDQGADSIAKNYPAEMVVKSVNITSP